MCIRDSYETMRGRRVERRFGWDTHGLPAELEAMRQLGMTTKQDILDLGIGQFNETCRGSVLTYTKAVSYTHLDVYKRQPTP